MLGEWKNLANKKKTWRACSVGIWYDDVCQGSHHNKKTKEIILPVLYVICEKKISYFNLSLKFLFSIAFSYFLPTKYDMWEKNIPSIWVFE